LQVTALLIQANNRFTSAAASGRCLVQGRVAIGHWGACLIHSCSNRLRHRHWECASSEENIILHCYLAGIIQALFSACRGTGAVEIACFHRALTNTCTGSLHCTGFLFIPFLTTGRAKSPLQLTTVSLCKSMRQQYKGRKVSPVNFVLFRAAKLTSLPDSCLHGTNPCHMPELRCGSHHPPRLFPSGTFWGSSGSSQQWAAEMCPLPNAITTFQPQLSLRELSVLFGDQCFHGSKNQSCWSVPRNTADREVGVNGTKMRALS